MKFQIGDMAKVLESVNEIDFQKHVLPVGTICIINAPYEGWKREAYKLQDVNGKILTEYLLAEELEIRKISN